MDMVFCNIRDIYLGNSWFSHCGEDGESENGWGSKSEGKIEQLPKSPAFRATKVLELYTEEEILKNYLSFYAFLKTILKLPSYKREEFRRHVTLIVDLEKSTAEVNIDNLVNCERYVHGFLRYARDLIEGKKEEEEEE